MTTALCVVATLSALPAGAVQRSAAAEATARADELFRAGEFREALERIDAALAEDSGYAGAYYIGGFIYGATQRYQESLDYFVKATELRPGWADAHRMAALAALDTGRNELAWEHAVKAYQGGADPSEAIARLNAAGPQPDDLDAQLAAARVFVGPIDTETFRLHGDLSVGIDDATSKRIVSQSGPDLNAFRQEAQRQFASSRNFGLVRRPQQAEYVLTVDVNSLSGGSRNRLRGVLTLLDARTGEEAYRRRIDFSSLGQRSELHREFSRIMGLLNEWAVEQRR